MRLFNRYHISFRLLLDATIIAAVAAVIAYLVFGGNADPESGNAAYRWTWQQVWQFFVWRDDAGNLQSGLLLRGLATTLRLGLWSMLLAGAMGVCFGFMRCSGSIFLKLISGTYVGTVRNIPPLVLVFVMHFFVSTLFEPHIPWDALRTALSAIPLAWVFIPLEGNLPLFCSAVVALGVYEGAYATEVVRAGLESVPRGQWEAAASLGLPRYKTMRSVILPQAFRLMLPPLTSQAVSLVKDSSIVSAISVAELTFQSRELINTTFMVFELWITITLLYLAMSLIISGIGTFLERRIKWHLI